MLYTGGAMSKAHREYLYGVNPAFEAIRGGRRRITLAYLNERTAGSPRLRKLRDLIERRAIPIELVDKGRLMDLAKSKEHQGVVLRSSTYPYAAFEDMLDTPRLLLLDNVEDPHNVGAILRSAEIFGFHDVLLSLKGVPDIYPSVVKVSAGATEFLRICKDHSANRYARAALDADYTVIALDGKGKARLDDLRHQSFARLLLVVGGENRAVGQYILNEAHYVAGIEQHGRVNSLNASVAAGIAMHALSGPVVT